MKRRIFLYLFVLVFSLPALAQFTTVSGTVVDPNGLPYANGTIVPTLVSSASPTLNGLGYTPPAGPVGLDVNGSFIMNLANQASLLPAGTTWTFNVCSSSGTILPSGGTGPQCFVVTGIVVAGASQSISATLNAAALSLSKIASNGVNLTPTTSQTINQAGSTTGGLFIENFPCASLNSETLNNAGCATAWNRYVVNSINTTNNALRRALNIYFQTNMQQGNEYDAQQIRCEAVLDANSNATNSNLNCLDLGYGVNGNNITVNSMTGLRLRPRLTGNGTVTSWGYISADNTGFGGAGNTIADLGGLEFPSAAAGTTVTRSTMIIARNTQLWQNGAFLSGSINAMVADDSRVNGPICHGVISGLAGTTPHDCFLGGTGSPETVVTANVGSIFVSQNGTAGTTLFVKESGSGNTGWLAKTSVFVASLVTTAAASDNVTVTGMTASGHCSVDATNALAATNIATTFVSAKAANQITVTHTVAANMNYDVMCTPN